MEAEPTVFIVDDDPAVRQALTVLVRSMHLRAEAYESAQQFLDACGAARPGCLLLDVRMPGMSGLELLEQLNRSEVHMPAIVMSAYGDVPMVVRAMKAGAVNFLEKPCRDQQLWEAIQEGLRWDAAHRQHVVLRTQVLHRLQRLTPGEHQVLQRLIDGESNKTIAAELALERAHDRSPPRQADEENESRLAGGIDPRDPLGRPPLRKTALAPQRLRGNRIARHQRLALFVLDFSLSPLGVGESVSSHVARSLDIVE